MTAVLTTIASFNSANDAYPAAGANGAFPAVDLIADANGDLFGTTSNGGAYGDGTVFEIVNNGSLAAPQYASAPTTLVSFNDADGADPFGGLIADANGDLFGATAMYGDPVTFETGTGVETVYAGSGTAFEIVNTGTVAAPQYASTPTTLVNFVGPSASYPGGNLVPDTTGTYPTGLIADANGNLFGATIGSMISGPGTVFEMVNTGTAAAPQYASTPTTLLTFDGTDVASTGVIADANDDLFGVTTEGQLFEIANTGAVAAPQYASAPVFLASLDTSSSSPSSGLTVDAHGDLFGVEIGEVGTSLDATVFEMANIGTVAAPRYASTPTTLASFNSSAIPFYQPDGGGGKPAALILDAKGDLFGVAYGSGSGAYGSVFEIVNDGTVAAPQYASTPTIVATFNGDPANGLTADADGDLFGATITNEANGQGSVFEITGSGFAPFAAPTTQTPSVAITSAGGQTNNPNQTISGTVTEPTEAEVVGTTVYLYDNGSTTALGSATVQPGGGWSTTVTLSQGASSIVASDTDLAGDSGSSSAVSYTLDTQTPSVAISSAGASTTNPSQTISGTVTEPVESEVAGTTVSLYDNGSSAALGTAIVQANGTWSTTVTLGDGANSITASDTDLAGNTGVSSPDVYTLNLTVPTITSASYSGSKTRGDWSLGGGAAAGSAVTVYDGAATLGTTTASSTGAWTFTTAENDSAIRDYTVTVTVAGDTTNPSAAYIEGTPGADTFSFASEAALSAAALINGGAGTNTIQITAPATLTDADFAHALSIETLGLSGASSVTLGTNAQAAGIGTVVIGAGNTSITDANSGTLAVTATALGAGALLSLAGSTADSVTGLTGNLTATGDSGALNVTTGAAAALSIATGTGSSTINASAMTSLDTLTLTGSHAATVRVGGNLSAGGDTGALTVSATGSRPHTIQTGSGADSITASHGGDTIESGGADSINVTGHRVADSFVFAAASDSLNTVGGHDTISGFLAGGSVRDLVDFSSLNSGLNIEGQLSGGTVAADSIGWLYSAGNAMIYVNDTGGALATSNMSLMEITLAGVSTGVSGHNFKA